MTSEELDKLVNEFLVKHGKPPTHVLCTTQQQDDLTSEFSGRERITGAEHPDPNSKIVSYLCKGGFVVDLIPVSALRSGRSNLIDFPSAIIVEGK